MRSALVVDDDPLIRRMTEALLSAEGLAVATAASGEQARSRAALERFDVILTDLRLPDVKGLELVSELRGGMPAAAILVMTAYASVSSAVEAMKAGATDYIVKPFQAEDLRHRVRKALELVRLEADNLRLRQDLGQSLPAARIVAASPLMREVTAKIEKLARTDLSVFLLGESGTGKEVLARALHYDGPRAEGPFVAVNCAALPRELAESELFGSAKGAFTGAIRDRVGKIEAADGGTLFLDEVTELPLDTQPKLLRVLEERAVERVGETAPRAISIRVVAATNRDPRTLVQEGQFRDDLYFRLAVAPVHVPPLRDRKDDVAPLVRFFLRRLAGDAPSPEITQEALDALEREAWPGNVRELKNVIERAFALSEGGPIGLKDVRSTGWEAARVSRAGPVWGHQTVVLPDGGASLDDMIRDLLMQALTRTAWNQSAAARLLRVPRHILQYRMAKYGISSRGRA